MVIKSGRYGKFAACPNYPSCKNTRPIDSAGKEKSSPDVETSERICELCGKPMVIRNGKFGSFYACSAFPKCRNTVTIETALDVLCPLCASPVVARKGKNGSPFYGCSSYPQCTFVSWYKPSNERCSVCGSTLYYRKPDDERPVCLNKECQCYNESESKQ